MANQAFDCSLVVRVPFPTERLAEFALRALSVDEELSPLVKRSFSVQDATTHTSRPAFPNGLDPNIASEIVGGSNVNLSNPSSVAPDDVGRERFVLVADYRATTNRMLRVSVNGFFESLSVIISCMRELDEDVVLDDWKGEGNEEIDCLSRVQGLQEVGALNA